MNKLLFGKVIKKENATCDFCGEGNILCFGTDQEIYHGGVEKGKPDTEKYQIDICTNCVEEMHEHNKIV